MGLRGGNEGNAICDVADLDLLSSTSNTNARLSRQGQLLILQSRRDVAYRNCAGAVPRRAVEQHRRKGRGGRPTSQLRSKYLCVEKMSVGKALYPLI